eukprot:211087_1
MNSSYHKSDHQNIGLINEESQRDTQANETISVARRQSESICESLKSCALWKLVLYAMILTFSVQLPNIMLPQLGAKYFHEDSNDNCSSGNSKWAYFSGIMSSVGGGLAFLFEGYLGRLSDIYGRKSIMYFTWSLLFIPYFPMIFTKNVWFFLILSPLISLCGALGGVPTVLQAAIADTIISKKNRTTIFAMLYGIGGIIVLIASITTQIVTHYFNDQIVFWIF